MRKLVFMLLLFSSVVTADPLDELVEAIQLSVMIEKAFQECRASAASILAGELSFDSQKERLLLRDDEEALRQLLQIYDDYFALSCSYLSHHDAESIFRDVYASNLTEKEIAELLEFFQSPLGAKLIRLDLEANSLLQEHFTEKYGEYGARSQLEFERRIAEFWRKQQNNQKDEYLKGTRFLSN